MGKAFRSLVPFPKRTSRYHTVILSRLLPVQSPIRALSDVSGNKPCHEKGKNERGGIFLVWHINLSKPINRIDNNDCFASLPRMNDTETSPGEWVYTRHPDLRSTSADVSESETESPIKTDKHQKGSWERNENEMETNKGRNDTATDTAAFGTIGTIDLKLTGDCKRPPREMNREGPGPKVVRAKKLSKKEASNSPMPTDTKEGKGRTKRTADVAGLPIDYDRTRSATKAKRAKRAASRDLGVGVPKTKGDSMIANFGNRTTEVYVSWTDADGNKVYAIDDANTSSVSKRWLHFVAGDVSQDSGRR